MSTRRQFLVRASATGLLSIGAAPPLFLARAATQTKERSTQGRILVVVQLTGGNDGLNTVVPHADDDYFRNRPGIAIRNPLVLDDYHALHPSMTGFQKLYDEGMLGIVQGVGYPNPDRSHFRSMDIWHSADLDVSKDDGWLGRALEQREAAATAALCVGEQRLPLALVSSKVNVPGIQSLEDYRLVMTGGTIADRETRKRLMLRFAESQSENAADSDNLAFLRRTAATAYVSADRLKSVAESYKPAAPYPATALAQKLKLIAQIIASGLETEIFFVSLDGFDTHASQEAGHAALLKDLSDALHAFLADLKAHGEADRTLVATFSEFGRRVKENGSLGTDHGAASQMFLLSPSIKAGIHGDHPSLTDLDQGDLRHSVDFRVVYATLLEKWLGRSSAGPLGGAFAPLDIIA